MDDQAAKAMMYWSTLFQDKDSELEQKVNEHMLEQSLQVMEDDEPENPLLDEKEGTKVSESRVPLGKTIKTTKLLKNLFAPT